MVVVATKCDEANEILVRELEKLINRKVSLTKRFLYVAHRIQQPIPKLQFFRLEYNLHILQPFCGCLLLFAIGSLMEKKGVKFFGNLGFSIFVCRNFILALPEKAKEVKDGIICRFFCQL